MSVGHQPVLLEEVLQALQPRPGGAYIDCTVGDGGHAAAILERSAPDGRLLGLEADQAAVAMAAGRLAPFGDRVVLIQRNFRHLDETTRQLQFPPAAGVLLDLGMSSRQLGASGRGFSFQHDEPLDMRFDPSVGLSAAELLNQLSEEAIADLLFQYGDERRSRRIARAIVQRRVTRRLARTADLVDAVQAAVGPRRGRIHPATRTFQALRIAVNDELGALEAVLPKAVACLRAGGRLAVISFHSLEDRIVKRFIRSRAVASSEQDLLLLDLSRRPVVASGSERAANPRARSAKLRFAERR